MTKHASHPLRRMGGIIYAEIIKEPWKGIPAVWDAWGG